MLGEVLINSAFMTLAVYITFWKLDIYKILGFDVAVDVLFSISLAIFMQGTYGGSMTAIVSGLMLGLILRTTRWLIGYKSLKRNGFRYYWTYHPR